MSRCESCGKRDRAATHECWECGRTHWRGECAGVYFNDPLRWCWCGSPHDSAATSVASVVRWLGCIRRGDEMIV